MVVNTKAAFITYINSTKENVTLSSYNNTKANLRKVRNIKRQVSVHKSNAAANRNSKNQFRVVFLTKIGNRLPKSERRKALFGIFWTGLC